jgi:hypothetical protein
VNKCVWENVLLLITVILLVHMDLCSLYFRGVHISSVPPYICCDSNVRNILVLVMIILIEFHIVKINNRICHLIILKREE